MPCLSFWVWVSSYFIFTFSNIYYACFIFGNEFQTDPKKLKEDSHSSNPSHSTWAWRNPP